MIELAGAVWDVSPGVAVRRLAAMGSLLPPERAEASVVRMYAASYPEYRARLAAFFSKAAEYLPRTHNPTLAGLRTKFRLTNSLPEERWAAGMGRMLGACQHLTAERAFCPNSVEGGRSKSMSRVFRGRGWGDVMCVPHHDLPGRQCGFLFAGRGGRPEDLAYRSMTMIGRVDPSHTHNEGGLACFDAAHRSDGMCGEHVIACGDAFLALRLHLRHFATSKTPLPLVAYYDGVKARTRHGWAALDGKVPVLWGWRLTPSLLYQAMRADGKIVLSELMEVTQFRIDHFVRLSEPRDIMRRLVKYARPWREYLGNWADKVSDGAVQEMLMGLEAYGVTAESLAELSPRIKALANVPDKPKQVALGRFQVVEKNGQWWECRPPRSVQGVNRAEQEPKLIMSATLRIDGTCIQRSNDSDREVVQYKGRLIHEGDEIPFAYSIDTLANYAPRLLAKLLAKHKPKAEPLFISPGWQSRLVQAAILFARGQN